MARAAWIAVRAPATEAAAEAGQAGAVNA
jgi:hypothetical protein